MTERTVVVLTRMGMVWTDPGVSPSEDRVDHWMTVSANVAARTFAQTTLPHHWVWMTCPERYDQVLEFTRRHGLDVHVHLQDAETPPEDIPGDTFLTVRLDADDAWLPHVFDTMPRNLRTGHIAHWPNGHQIDMTTSKGCRLSYTRRWTSPYVAIPNDSRQDMLDLHGQHPDLPRKHRIIDRKEPGWLQLVGDWNTRNRFDKWEDGRFRPAHDILKETGLEPTDMAWLGELDRLAAKYGTDKGSAPRRDLFPKRYTPVYEDLFSSYRDQPITLVEFGVQTGASIRMWLDWLPKAHVIGVDVKTCPEVLQGAERYTHVQGRQADPGTISAVLEAAGSDTVDAVIDDCSHKHDDHRETLRLLGPRTTGWWAIEDLQATPDSVPWLEGLGAEFHCDGRLALLQLPALTSG